MNINKLQTSKLFQPQYYCKYLEYFNRIFTIGLGRHLPFKWYFPTQIKEFVIFESSSKIEKGEENTAMVEQTEENKDITTSDTTEKETKLEKKSLQKSLVTIESTKTWFST